MDAPVAWGCVWPSLPTPSLADGSATRIRVASMC